MSAATQYKISAGDLSVILALVRNGTLAESGERLGVDSSTVFRTIQRIEKGLGQQLFERSRSGFIPSELARELGNHGEQMEVQLEAARSVVQLSPEQVSGTVRISTTDTILHGLVAPALKALGASHPLLNFEINAGNELASLTRRDADIAIRATKRPPQHLVGKHVGPIRVALFSSKRGGIKKLKPGEAVNANWIATDEALPDHPSVVWRKKHYPKAKPTFSVNSILTVAEFVAQGLGVGVLPMFLAQGRSDLHQLTPVLDECQTELWLLTHSEFRHLRRVSAVFSHLSKSLVLA